MTKIKASSLAALALIGAMGCNDFLSGGELDTDPVRPTAATNRQLFVGVQTNTAALLASDPARIAGLFTQQFEGIQSQYFNIYTYSVNEQTTNGFQSGLYAGGGLRDLRQLQANARAQGDTLFLGIAQIQEALLIGTGADLFGDLVYSEALTEKPNPKLDEQIAIYTAVQGLLSTAISNLQAFRGTTTNLGPGSTDLNYGGNKDKWIRLARTLKARFHLHAAEVNPAAYALALAEARQGITDPADDYKAVFSGNAGETNFFYQFTAEQRFGYFIPAQQFITLLRTRNDPRLEEYVDLSGDSFCGVEEFCLAGDGEGEDERIDPGFDQPLVTAQENLLIWAESAQRGGDNAEARTQLDRARAIGGLTSVGATLTGAPLLREILTEKYIALFQNLEVYNDYKRTCFPNLTPTVSGQKIPARLFYDTAERQTNTNVPPAQSQPTRNDNDRPNPTSDGTGEVCRGQ